MSQKTIKPVTGRRVRQPDGELLPEAGKTVVWNAFWERRLRDGDIELNGGSAATTTKKEK
ncbi:MAG TPA: DUF2635 domain-containing protein [Fluviicoccus sp.]|nr:DUF2635 domain-containing protein [Fluviicoccus sp.]